MRIAFVRISFISLIKCHVWLKHDFSNIKEKKKATLTLSGNLRERERKTKRAKLVFRMIGQKVSYHALC